MKQISQSRFQVADNRVRRRSAIPMHLVNLVRATGKLWKAIAVRCRFVSLLIIVTWGILLAACGRSESGSAAVGAVSSTEQTEVSGNSSLPGTEEFGLSKEELVETVEAVEASISQCMTEQGFEYIPVDFNTVRRGMMADKSAPGLGESQYAARYGFGISTLYTGLPPQLADPAYTPGAVGLGEQNIRIFQNLSPADQTAYNHTLFGEHRDATFAVGLEVEDFSRTGGCTRQAIEEVFTQEQLSTTFLNPKDALIEQDPRMQEALVQFAECLRNAGFEYDLERDVEPDMRRRLDAITKGRPLEALSVDEKSALAALQKEEVALGVAVLSCEGSILDPVEDRIERELYSGYQG